MNKSSYISIDLDTDALVKYYSVSSPTNAYRDLRNYLTKCGFEHLKDTNYKSTTLDKFQAAKCIMDFANENKWFPLCATKIDVSIVSEPLSILKVIQDLCADYAFKMAKDNAFAEFKKELNKPSLNTVIKNAENRVVSPENYSWAKKESIKRGITTKEFINSVLDNERNRE